MFTSDIKYTNRYGNAYEFAKQSDTQYLFTIEDFGYGRMGGREGQEKVDMSDLGMCDPAGGPYISLGMELDERKITKISWHKDGFLLEVE